jgi:hypothetical protein
MWNRLCRVLLVLGFLFAIGVRPTTAAASPMQCGEYQCQHDWGTGIWVCFYDGDVVCDAYFGCMRCECPQWASGDCWWSIE